MDKLILEPKSALDPASIEIGKVTVQPISYKTILSVAPYRGRSMAVGESLSGLIKVGLPTAQRTALFDGGIVAWGGVGLWFVCGDFDAKSLTERLGTDAAVTEQTDAWEGFNIVGDDVQEVMSRLVSVDVRAIAHDHTLRTGYGQIAARVTSIPEGFEVMVARSYARTALEITVYAMQRLAARRGL